MKVVYIVFQLQFMVLLFFFIMNRRYLKKNRTYNDVVDRLHWIWYIIPLLLVTVVGIVVTYITGRLSSLWLGMLMVPILSTHFVSEPLVLRSVFAIGDMRRGSFRDMIVRGVRSRILTFWMCVNIVMMYYAFINCYAN